MLGKLCKCFGVLVVLVAIFVGMAMQGILTKWGFWWRLADTMEAIGSPAIVGNMPVNVSPEERANAFKVEDIPDLTGKVALVTGANIGLGYETALALAGKGATVVAACRSQAKCEKAASEMNKKVGANRVETLLVDNADLSSVERFSKEFLKQYKRLDIFVQNAGLASAHELELTKEGIEMVFQVNHLAHFLMTKHFLPLIEKTATKQDPARIVVVSSAAHYNAPGIALTLEKLNDPQFYRALGGIINTSYEHSKLANLLFGYELAKRTSDNVLVNMVHPGLVFTDFSKNFEGLFQRYPWLRNVFAHLLQFGWTPDEGALTQIFAATNVKENAQYYHPIARKVDPLPISKDEKTQKQFWEFSEALLAKQNL